MDQIIAEITGNLFQKGILLLPEKMEPKLIVKSILVVKNNIAFDGKFSNRCTRLKQAYETLTDSIHRELNIPARGNRGRN